MFPPAFVHAGGQQNEMPRNLASGSAALRSDGDFAFGRKAAHRAFAHGTAGVSRPVAGPIWATPDAKTSNVETKDDVA